jgi:hypothetical protein
MGKPTNKFVPVPVASPCVAVDVPVVVEADVTGVAAAAFVVVELGAEDVDEGVFDGDDSWDRRRESWLTRSWLVLMRWAMVSSFLASCSSFTASCELKIATTSPPAPDFFDIANDYFHVDI